MNTYCANIYKENICRNSEYSLFTSLTQSSTLNEHMQCGQEQLSVGYK